MSNKWILGAWVDESWNWLEQVSDFNFSAFQNPFWLEELNYRTTGDLIAALNFEKNTWGKRLFDIEKQTPFSSNTGSLVFEDIVAKITAWKEETQQERMRLKNCTPEGRFIASLPITALIRYFSWYVRISDGNDSTTDLFAEIPVFAKEYGYTQEEQNQLRRLFLKLGTKNLNIKLLQEILPVFIGYLVESDKDFAFIAYRNIVWSVDEFMYKDRYQWHAYRTKILKDVYWPLMKIITQNPLLKQAFDEILPSIHFKKGTEFSFTDNWLHRQLTAFMSVVWRSPELMALFYEHGMQVARERSQKMWEKIENRSRPLSLDTLVVWLGPNAWCMAETQRVCAPERADRSLFVGEEDWFGGTFNLWWFIQKMWWKVNSRTRAIDNNRIWLPTERWSINNPGAVSMVGESDLFSGDYADDAHWWFETFIKFMFHANYLLNCKVIYQRPLLSRPWEKELLLQNTVTWRCSRVYAVDTEYHTGLDKERYWFDYVDEETGEIINERHFSIESIREDVASYLHSADFKNWKGRKPYKETFPRTPAYFTGKDFMKLVKSDVPWQHLFAWRRILLIWSWDSANTVKEQLFVHGWWWAPRQVIDMPTVIEISSRATTKSTGKNKLRWRYQWQNNFSYDGKKTNNPNVFPLVWRSKVLLPTPKDSQRSFRVAVWLSEAIPNDYPRFLPDIFPELAWDEVGIDADIIIDCSWFSSKQWLQGTIVDNEFEIPTWRNIQIAMNRVGSSLQFDDDECTQVVVKRLENWVYTFGKIITVTSWLDSEEISPVLETRYEEIFVSEEKISSLLRKLTSYDSWYTVTKQRNELLNILWVPVRSNLQEVNINTLTIFKEENDEQGFSDYIEQDFSNPYVDELITSRFWRLWGDYLFLARKVGGSSDAWQTIIQWPAANLPLNAAEKRILVDRIGIPQNVVARFRFEPRITAYVLQRLLEKRKKLIGRKPIWVELNADDYESRVTTFSSRSLWRLNEDQIRMQQHMLYDLSFKHSIAVYVAGRFATVMKQYEDKINDLILSTFSSVWQQSITVSIWVKAYKEVDGTYSFKFNSATNNTPLWVLSLKLTALLCTTIKNDPLIRAYYIDKLVRGMKKSNGNGLFEIEIPFKLESNSNDDPFYICNWV